MSEIRKEVKKQFLKKKENVESIKKNISESSAVIFYNFSGAENEEIFSLKKRLSEVKSEFFVYKNTLFKKALGDKNFNIKENNAFIFCKGDEYKPLKILNTFIFRKELKNRIQGGIYHGNLVSLNTLKKWSNLKSKEKILDDFCKLLTFNIVKFSSLIAVIDMNRE